MLLSILLTLLCLSLEICGNFISHCSAAHKLHLFVNDSCTKGFDTKMIHEDIYTSSNYMSMPTSLFGVAAILLNDRLPSRFQLNNNHLWLQLNNDQSWSLLNDDSLWSELEVENNPNTSFIMFIYKVLQKRSYSLTVDEPEIFIRPYNMAYLSAIHVSINMMHQNVETELEVGNNLIPCFKHELEVISNPKISQTTFNLIELWNISKFFNYIKSVRESIAQFSLKIMIDFYLHLVFMSAISSCLDHQNYVKTVSLQLHRFCIAKHDYLILVLKNVVRVRTFNMFTFACLIYSIQLLLFYHCLQASIKTAHMCIFNIQTVTCWYNYDVSCTNFYNEKAELNLSMFNNHLHSISHWYGCRCQSQPYISLIGGGRRHLVLELESIKPFFLASPLHVSDVDASSTFKYVDHLSIMDLEKVSLLKDKYACILPLKMLRGHLSKKQGLHIAKLHGITNISRLSLEEVERLLSEHICVGHCKENVTVVEIIGPMHTDLERRKERYHALKSKVDPSKITSKLKFKTSEVKPVSLETKTFALKSKTCPQENIKISLDQNKDLSNKTRFPPRPPSKKLLHKILSGFTAETSPYNFVEAGCASCGQLTSMKLLKDLKSVKFSLGPLKSIDGLTRLERKTVNECITEIEGPVLAHGCNKICQSCCKYLKKGKTPPLSLANGLWLGEVPLELSDLTYVEQLLISRVRHNRCIVKVASGRYKMRANAISFNNPVPKIYDVLPPSIAELDEVLACIFTGPCQPTKADIERTPLLVRRNKVADALNWLKLNHLDYSDLSVSEENLLQYPEHDASVVIDYRQSVINKDKEATSVHDNEDEEGIKEGLCSFVVQGLTGDEYSTMSIDAIKARALEHLMQDGKIMFVGHSKDPLTIFKNPRMFPSMFPWLFPYGLGGLAQPRFERKMSSLAHKRFLLMYYDKRFQTDPNFPLIAFNHEQIQQSSTGSFLTAQKTFFSNVTDRLLNIDVAVLTDINRRLSLGERVNPKTDEEIACYKLMNDLDAVGGHVSGSLSKKKYMRNEIWSLISYVGAPSWFITLSPADNKHPICLYYADNDVEFKPDLRLPDEAYRLIAKNPVAAARFFHFICENVIKHIFGVGRKHPGLYGDTEAYYGVVEQQGRLTLHLHCILWIKDSPSPQEIRDRIMDKSSDFQKLMVEYLEGAHQGEMLEGSLEDVKARVKDESANNPEYRDPTQTLPEPPPDLCDNKFCTHCNICIKSDGWWKNFKSITDDLLSRSNYHTCNTSVDDKNGRALKKGCLNNKGECRARFPRDVVLETMVEPLTGALKLKKGEAWMNTFTPLLTYLIRCNTDTTSLLSGTAIKAIVAYVTDYVSKPGLTTYSVFETVKQVFGRNSEMLGGSIDRKEAARSLMTKMVNALTAKMELGSPMASLYLLGNPDHYTGHEFKIFFWKAFVREARKVWDASPEDEQSEKVILNKNLGKYVGLSNVQDYIYRPIIYKNVSLYEWIRRGNKRKCSIKERKNYNQHVYDSDITEDELDLLKGGGKPPSTIKNAVETDDELNIHEGDQTNVYHDLKKFQRFTAEHPQHLTHVVIYNEDDPKVVPHFIGGSLPRSDQGDREYYCSTMLSLFKPWRTGYDLKSKDETWDDAFKQHNFSETEKKYMQNFNLKYECNDARDDYSAKLKNDKKPSFIGSWATNETLNSLDASNGDQYEGLLDVEAAYEEALMSIDPHSSYFRKLGSMNKIEKIIRGLGWLDKLTEQPPSIDKAFQPDVNQSGSQWAAVVQTAKKQILAIKTKDILSSQHKGDTNNKHVNEVVISDMSYIDKHFQAKQEASQKFIDDTATEFNLNKEQNRAFRIVANHATLHRVEQLKMYLGGMGGTGKSQVIKALMAFFEKRKEAHRIMILAPTGSAAALLNGSTYHSALGIHNDETRNHGNEHSTLAQLRARLEGVEYIFLDEVSMVSCRDVYRISAQLAKLRNVLETPFGGINMIFAGDFAQLAPVKSAPLYSSLVGTTVDASMTKSGQENAIGKALWHQITTVVILRENMRQKTQSMEDAKLRKALENMRYASCTEDDITFLHSLIAGKSLQHPDISSPEFRNVSIITALNAEKDRINELGSKRFAEDTGQTLTDFYSIDAIGSSVDPETLRKMKRTGKKLSRASTIMNPKIQEMLWNLSHSETDHIPGKLSLCIGMPVMIRNNDATELCITKGQEGFVAGWQSAKGPSGQNAIDTLFVKLDKPAKTIKLDGLPENIVPLVRTSKHIQCKTPSDTELSISRSQVSVLPNFAMTDYASQGKTRLVNIVDLFSCRSHMAYYTALSRGSSAAKTAIIQGFDEKKITGGASGYLRQEFRELEILDEVTKLRFNGKLPQVVNGRLRNIIIKQYRGIKGITYCPENIAAPLRWTKDNPMEILPIVTDSPWTVIDTSKNKGKHILPKTANQYFVSAKGSIPVQAISRMKRKLSEISDDINNDIMENTNKKFKAMSEPNENLKGLAWDKENYSCAYDALYTILFNIWSFSPIKWKRIFTKLGPFSASLSDGFKDLLKEKASFETIRDKIRSELYHNSPDHFPYGQVGTDIGELVHGMFSQNECPVQGQSTCVTCNKTEILDQQSVDIGSIIYIKNSKAMTPINKIFQKMQEHTESCSVCQSPIKITQHYDAIPNMLTFMPSGHKVTISKNVRLLSMNGPSTMVPIRGIIYLGGFHFTTRVITPGKKVWYHDGQTTGNQVEYEGNLDEFSEKNLYKCRDRIAVAVIYGKK